MQSRLRKLENMHIAFWLLKDVGWVQDLTPTRDRNGHSDVCPCGLAHLEDARRHFGARTQRGCVLLDCCERNLDDRRVLL
jgi:hypothetical protein